jgi:cytochrome bd-type quinol oxidase subunit 2
VRLHLDALILLHRVWGAFGVLSGTSLALLALGTELALRDVAGSARAEHTAVAVLSACAVLLSGVGFGALFAARGLKRRKQAGRAAALAFAIPNLIVVPFGTVLGVYTFWVLLNNDARREFGRPPRGLTPSGVDR